MRHASGSHLRDSDLRIVMPGKGREPDGRRRIIGEELGDASPGLPPSPSVSGTVRPGTVGPYRPVAAGIGSAAQLEKSEIGGVGKDRRRGHDGPVRPPQRVW